MSGPTVAIVGAFIGSGMRVVDPRSIVPPSGRWPLLCACDRPPDGPQPEGEIVTLAPPFDVPGWSYVSWWDRHGPDTRRNVTTGILAPGTWTPEQLIAATRVQAPWAFRVTVQTGAR